MEDGQPLLTELPALTPTRGTTLIHRSGHCYQLHRPHLAVSAPPSQHDSSPNNQPKAANATEPFESAAQAATKPSLPREDECGPTPHLSVGLYAENAPRQQATRQSRYSANNVGYSTHVSSLYPELLALIFSYLDVWDRGRAAQVCTAWRDAAYHRSVWRGIEARLHLRKQAPALFNSLVRRGIKRVQVLSLRRGLGEVFKGIPNLESLNLSGCYNVTDSGISNALVQESTSLTELNLSLCKQVTDTSLKQISEMLPNLELLELGGCSNITNNGLFFIAKGLKKLKKLDLRSCWHISDVGIAHMAGLTYKVNGNPALEHLGLQDCQRLTDEALRHISAGFSNLKSINLSFCIYITNSGLKYLAKMVNLRHLNLRSCDRISDYGIAYLAEGGSKISSLDVAFCEKIGDQALVHISQGLFLLRSLSLSACRVSDEGIARIAKNLPDLETLNIGQCTRLTDKGLHTIADSMKHLKCIDLYGCTRITTDGLEIIMKLPQLNTLNLGLWHR